MEGEPVGSRPVSRIMAVTLTPSEEAQLMQTIEMFEVITQAQPLDYQSLEILKEAYTKLERETDIVGTSRRIAEAYVQVGQLSSAILEYESILQRRPEDPDIRQALQEIENRANGFVQPTPEARAETADAPVEANSKPNGAQAYVPPSDLDDGKSHMRKIFVDSKIISPTDFDSHWPAPILRVNLRQPGETFVQLLEERQVLPVEKSLKLICERTRSAYLPVDRYDIDVDFARSSPRDVCMRWSVLPFDRMSKSVCVATVNPCNRQAQRELEAHLRARVIWYVSPPAELAKTLKRIFR